MDLKPLCKVCQSVLVGMRGGYCCPKCHSLYTIMVELVWNGDTKRGTIINGDS